MQAAKDQAILCICAGLPGIQNIYKQGSRYLSTLSPNAKNNKFGTKNINLATTIGERKITQEIFCLA